MLLRNTDLDDVRACYGKSWNPQNKVCTGGAPDHANGGAPSPPCDVEKSCKISFAHRALEGIIPANQLNRASRPAQQPQPATVTHTPPARTEQALPGAQPAQHPLASVQQVVTATNPFSVPMGQGGQAMAAPVHYNPVAVYAPGFITSSEPKGKHSRVKRLAVEVARGGLKGMAMQFGHFMDTVNWLDD